MIWLSDWDGCDLVAVGRAEMQGSGLEIKWVSRLGEMVGVGDAGIGIRRDVRGWVGFGRERGEWSWR